MKKQERKEYSFCGIIKKGYPTKKLILRKQKLIANLTVEIASSIVFKFRNRNSA